MGNSRFWGSKKSGVHLKQTEIAELLNVHPNTVANYIKSGVIAGTDVSDVVAYVRRQEFGRMKQYFSFHVMKSLTHEDYESWSKKQFGEKWLVSEEPQPDEK